MSVRVVVALLSGRQAAAEAEPEMNVGELMEIVERKFRAQKTLDSNSCLRWLLTSAGETLSHSSKVGDVLSGDEVLLTAVTKARLWVASTSEKRAVVETDGTLRTLPVEDCPFPWLFCDDYIKKSSVQGELKDVQQIQATKTAFAALLRNGSVVTWGHRSRGGDSRALREQLQDVLQLQATKWAFAALRSDKTVVAWGDPVRGGNMKMVSGLTDVVQLYSTRVSFAALRGDGSVVAWGERHRGGTVPSSLLAPEHALGGAQSLEATDYAFAAVLRDGSVVTWGEGGGSDTSEVQGQLNDVKLIRATEGAFGALRGNGTVVCWGFPEFGGCARHIQHRLQNVEELHATQGAFAALRADGSVVAWGIKEFGGCTGEVEDQLRNVRQILAYGNRFEAILADGSLVDWPDR